jgi:hypothetical protein
MPDQAAAKASAIAIMTACAATNIPNRTGNNFMGGPARDAADGLRFDLNWETTPKGFNVGVCGSTGGE